MFQTVGPRCCAAIIPGGAAAPPYPLHRLSLGIGITPVRRSLFRCEAMASRKGRGRSRMQGRSKPTRMSLGQHKSEGRNPRAERSPKPEIRRTNRLTSRSAFRASDFGFLSVFGLRASGFVPESWRKAQSDPAQGCYLRRCPEIFTTNKMPVTPTHNHPNQSPC
jgi:hypothetical protein